MKQIYNSLKNVDSSVRKLSCWSFVVILVFVTFDSIIILLKSVSTKTPYEDIIVLLDVLSKYFSILLNIGFSIFTSCIFYYFTIHLPEEKKKNISFLYVRERINQLDSEFSSVGESIGIKWEEDIESNWMVFNKLYDIDENTKIEGVEGIIGEPTYITFFGKAFQIMLEHVEKIINTNIIIDDEVLFAALAIHNQLIDMQSEVLAKRVKEKRLSYLTNPLLNIRSGIGQLNHYVDKMNKNLGFEQNE